MNKLYFSQHSCLFIGSYDALTGSGTCILGGGAHVPSEAINEMVRLVKPGML